MQAIQDSSVRGGSQAQGQHLLRGQACITCRRKKMRCDGARPFCGQCGMTRRPEDCEYTDRQGRTTTEVLEERLDQLKARIRELEVPSTRVQPVFLHNPYADRSPAGPSVLNVGGPEGPNSPHDIQDSGYSSNHIDSGRQSALLASAASSSRHSEQSVQELFATFLPHASRLGFSFDIPSFLASIAKPEGDPARPHNGLLDVLTLWALRLARLPDFILHESFYIAKALESLPLAVGSASPAHQLQLVQAEVLLALYFFCDGRLLEGRYHASAAMSSALSLHLHRIGAPLASPTTAMAGLLLIGNMAGMAAPHDAPELGERISVFWSAYLLDRCWSVALGSPPSLLDERPPSVSIISPLPRPLDEYAQMELDEVTKNGHSLCEFMNGTADYSAIGDRSTVYLSLVVTSALFERATRLLGGVNSETAADPSFLRRVADLETIVAKFNDALKSGISRQARRSTVLTTEVRRMFVTARSVGQVSIIQLHNLLSESSSVSAGVRGRSRDLCVEAAIEVAAIVRELDADDIGFLNPIIGVAWLSTLRILAKELKRLQHATGSSAQEARSVNQIAAEVDVVDAAMNKLGSSCPVFAYQATAFSSD